MVVSIIIPTYNAERFLPRCIHSIYDSAPSYGLFEVIVVNDGSTDNTQLLIEEYSEKYSNIVVVDQENGGVSVARNHGISVARGDYVLFLDADDELIEGALTKACAYLVEHEPMDMLVTVQMRRKGEQEWMVRTPSLEEHRRYDGVEAYKSRYIRTNAGGGICRIVFLRDNNLFFPEGVTNGEDTIFFAQVQMHAQSIVFYNLLLYRINEVDGSASRNNIAQLGNRLVKSMCVVADIRSSLSVTRQQKGVFDYMVYQMLSNTTSSFAQSKELSYRQLKREIDLDRLLPLDTKNMYLMCRQARLMNFSYSLFYFFSWVKNKKCNS